ncbi:MAG TPA: formyltransferase family protein, partial [Rhizomicrobium sp.]|nr:formyltransferase family protein [Rhizomicrobium sp.]
MRVLVIAARIVGHRCLEAMLEAGAEVSALLYLDDSKAGVTVAHSEFDDLIAKYRLNARAFASLKGDEGARHLAFASDTKPDLGIVIGVSELVPPEMLALASKGFIGMHPTLLPEGRGRAPIPWALIHDLKQTGVTLFYADPGVDTGDILDQEIVPVFDDDTAPILGARTDDAACRLFVKNLPLLANGTAARRKQDDRKATYWPRRKPQDGLIDWRKDSRALYNWVRALTRPYPGAFTFHRGRKLFVWQAEDSRRPA